MYQFIIAEKTSVAQTIAAALGVKKKKDGYIAAAVQLNLPTRNGGNTYGKSMSRASAALYQIQQLFRTAAF